MRVCSFRSRFISYLIGICGILWTKKHSWLKILKKIWNLPWSPFLPPPQKKICGSYINPLHSILHTSLLFLGGVPFTTHGISTTVFPILPAEKTRISLPNARNKCQNIFFYLRRERSDFLWKKISKRPRKEPFLSQSGHILALKKVFFLSWASA